MVWILKKLPITISLLILFFAVLLKVQQSSVIELLQNKVFDIYQQQFPRPYEPAGVRIVDIDDDSLERLGQWPWPRQIMAQLVDRLIEHGAAVTAFDIVYAEEDRTSPKSIAQMWHAENDLTDRILALPDHDQILSDAFQSGYIVTGYVLTHEQEDGRKPAKKFGLSYTGMEGATPAGALAHYSGSTLNLPVLEEAAEGNGFFTTSRDPDGIIRRIPLALTLDDDVYFSLSMEALRVAQGASSYLIKMAGASGEETFGFSNAITQIRNGQFEIPTDAAGNFLLHYSDYTQDRYVPAWKILEPDFDTSLIKDHILFMGTSAAGLQDLRPTPLNPELPGVELHVQALEQILTGHFLHRPDWMMGAEIVYMVSAGLSLMFMMARLTAIWGAVFMLVAQSGALWFSVHLFRTEGLLVDPISPGMVILLLYLSESLRRYILSESERKQVRGAFSQYMSPDLVQELANHPEKLTLGGEMKDLTVLFCDIRGFTTISERFDAQQLTAFINRFLTPMTQVILQHQGTIDKYMGDCIMAFWNAPLDDPQHARHACQSALRMMDALDELNDDRQRLAEEEGWDYFPVQIGIGLNSGEMCVGNMGSDQRFDYSVLGDDVNLASRLEGQSKTYGAHIVIGDNTYQQVTDMATLELDLIQVKGKTEAITIYTLLGEALLADDAEFIKLNELWMKALHSYRAQQWDEAENFIARCRTQSSKVSHISLDGLFALYEERLAAYRVNPPPEDWDGVFRATSK